MTASLNKSNILACKGQFFATSMVSVYFLMFQERSRLLNARGKGLDYILSGSTVDFMCCMVEMGFNSSCWKIWSNLFCLSKDMVMPWRFLLLVTSAQCRMTWWSWHQLPDYDLLSTFILHLQTIQLVAFPKKNKRRHSVQALYRLWSPLTELFLPI